MKKILWIALLASAATAQAQSTPASTAAPVSAAKKELVQRVISLQQPSVEGLARNMAEQPLRQMMGQAQQAMQSIPEDKRPAVAAKIEGFVNKYIDETNPLVKEKAAKVGLPALGPVFEEKYSEDELRQLLVVLESPAYKKYQQVVPDLNNALLQKLGAEMRPTLEPKLDALHKSVGEALGVTAASEPAKDAKPAAAKPKAKK
jgi:uncharacterized protein